MMIHKNWQELIRPTALEIKVGADPHRRRPPSPSRWSVASA